MSRLGLSPRREPKTLMEVRQWIDTLGPEFAGNQIAAPCGKRESVCVFVCVLVMREGEDREPGIPQSKLDNKLESIFPLFTSHQLKRKENYRALIPWLLMAG